MLDNYDELVRWAHEEDRWGADPCVARSVSAGYSFATFSRAGSQCMGAVMFGLG